MTKLNNLYVFYVKCGSIKRTLNYVFTGTKMVRHAVTENRTKKHQKSNIILF